ncbi:helix-turn-helix domain-containing protein [Streptomyces griseomycini]|uniref:Transposase n=1 Tax=Streptomyces griseomycini TaxID=66895 RepID=A0A7W7PWX8_9ACTN|nr:helix-turn-helix domain-containing protein [Streptomyces griseomycini]MBB4902871.1 transposase [Streptomyces griseomycini]
MVSRARPSRDENEQQVVRRLSRARKAPRDLVVRARTVEPSWSGQRVPAIADELRCSPRTVRRWLHRFNRSGLDGLEDLGGQGRKRRITEAERSRIIGLVRQAPPGRLTVRADGELAAADESGPPKWALDSLTAEARGLGIAIGRSQVRRILLAEGVRRRRTRSWTRSKDADFEGEGPGSSGSAPARPKARRSSAPTGSDR